MKIGRLAKRSRIESSSVCGGFTLIELLTVVAIISLLAAILFPVFAKAKEAAFKASCISNVKQLFVGQALYQEDYDDRYVLYFSGYVPNDPTGVTYYPPLSYWPQSISPFIQKATLPVDGSQALIQNLSAVFCDPMKGRCFQDPQLWSIGNISSWGISDDIGHWRAPSGQTPTYTSISGGEVSSAGSCLLLVETWDYWSPNHDLAGSAFGSSYFEGTPLTNGAIQFVDSPYQASYRKTSAALPPDPKGRNVSVFCDGHSQALITGRLTQHPDLWSASGSSAWP